MLRGHAVYFLYLLLSRCLFPRAQETPLSVAGLQLNAFEQHARPHPLCKSPRTRSHHTLPNDILLILTISWNHNDSSFERPLKNHWNGRRWHWWSMACYLSTCFQFCAFTYSVASYRSYMYSLCIYIFCCLAFVSRHQWCQCVLFKSPKNCFDGVCFKVNNIKILTLCPIVQIWFRYYCVSIVLCYFESTYPSSLQPRWSGCLFPQYFISICQIPPLWMMHSRRYPV